MHCKFVVISIGLLVQNIKLLEKLNVFALSKFHWIQGWFSKIQALISPNIKGCYYQNRVLMFPAKLIFKHRKTPRPIHFPSINLFRISSSKFHNNLPTIMQPACVSINNSIKKFHRNLTSKETSIKKTSIVTTVATSISNLSRKAT